MWDFVSQSVSDGTVIGLPYALAFLGVWLVFRGQQDFDLTIDGSFSVGGAVSTALIVAGWDPWLTLAVSACAGGVAGSLTYILKRLLDLSLVLISITVSLGLYSVALLIMGQPNVSLIGSDTIFRDWNELFGGGTFVPDGSIVALAGLIALIVFSALAFFLRSEVGLAFRASGLNKPMARGMGISPPRMLLLSIVLCNALGGISGALVAQQQGFADVTMGTGIILFGITAVLLGEVVFSISGTVRLIVWSVLIGTLLYRIILAGAFEAGVPPQYFQGITAIMILASIAVGRAIGSYRRRRRLQADTDLPAADPTGVASPTRDAGPAAGSSV